MVLLGIILIIVGAFGNHLNPKGPTHIKYATNCLESIISGNFIYMDEYGRHQENITTYLLLTVLKTHNLSAPGYQIQENILKKLNTLSKWGIEIVDDHQHDFESYFTDSNGTIKNYFMPILKSHFYFMVVDSHQTFRRKLRILIQLKTYNPKALFLVYSANLLRNDYKKYAQNLVLQLKRELFVNAFVLIPSTLSQFELYSLDYNIEEGSYCGPHKRIYLQDSCIKGDFVKKGKKYYEYRFLHPFNNCTVYVRANSIEPFVIDDDEGIEIELLQVMGEKLHVNINTTLTDEETWGEKIDGKWTLGFGQVYKHSMLGIGNIDATGPNLSDDFEFTENYYTENLVWVVPRAQFIPKWRVLTVIFSAFLWAICLGLIIISALFLWITAKYSKTEIPYYKSVGNDFLISFQIMITSIVFKQPKSDLTRAIFASLAIFSIVISSVYTSSLITYLKNPQREPQISTVSDILRSNLRIKSLPFYRDIFNVSEDDTMMEIFDKYESEDSEDEDIVSKLLNQVASKRDIAFIYSEFFIKYKMAHPEVFTADIVDDDHHPQIFILKNKIRSYTLSMVAKRGDPMTNKFSKVIRQLSVAGLVNKMERRYLSSLEKIKYDDDSQVVNKLSMDNLQGAFAIIILGYIFGFLSFIVENIVKLINNRK